MKKTLCFLLCAVFILAAAPLRVSAAVDGKGVMPVEVKAKAAVLMDQTTGKVLMSMNGNEPLFPASVTKIMSMLLVVEAIDSGKIALSDAVTASADAASKGGSQIWLKEGESMTVEELLKATAVYSANDACSALGEYVAGSPDGFVMMMNERAEQLGMKNTNFENCTGLDDESENHKTTAMDIALMSRELMKHEMIKKYTTIWMDSLRSGATELVNTNKLIRFYNGATGLKTGTTAKAGCCISATAERDSTALIAVVLGAANSSDRFEGAKAMLNWGFANYTTVSPEPDTSLIKDVNIISGTEKTITPLIPSAFKVLVPKGREKDITRRTELAAEVAAPVEDGQVLGTVTISLGDEVLGQYKLTAPHYVGRLTFPDVFKGILRSACKKV